MEINIKLSEEIINQSLRLHYSFAPAKQRYSILFLPAALVVIAAFLVIRDLGKNQVTNNIWLAILYVVLAIGYYFYMRHRRLNTGAQLMKAMGSNSNFTMKVDDTELITRLDSSTLTHPWEAFHRAVSNHDLVLLYQPNQSFSMFHRSFFRDQDFDLFQKMVSDHVTGVTKV